MAEPFSVSLEAATLIALDALAEKTEQTRDILVVRAVEDFIALNASQLQKVERGIRAAEEGAFATDEDVSRVRKKFAIQA